jgi:GrpB-like predicted nucleotidyltransferase (UPF0157 family)
MHPVLKAETSAVTTRQPLIGLMRGTVRVVPHQEEWRQLFEQERGVLQEHIGSVVLDIQHVGSTAIPGLTAKPIIDIAVAVTSLDLISQCRQPLLDLGYIDRGDAGCDGGYLFVKEGAPEMRTHHLHLVTIDDSQWGNYLRFRDMLRIDTLLRARYDALKQTLQAQFAYDRYAYTRAKEAFVQDTLEGCGFLTE